MSDAIKELAEELKHYSRFYTLTKVTILNPESDKVALNDPISGLMDDRCIEVGKSLHIQNTQRYRITSPIVSIKPHATKEDTQIIETLNSVYYLIKHIQ